MAHLLGRVHFVHDKIGAKIRRSNLVAVRSQSTHVRRGLVYEGRQKACRTATQAHLSWLMWSGAEQLARVVDSTDCVPISLYSASVKSRPQINVQSSEHGRRIQTSR